MSLVQLRNILFTCMSLPWLNIPYFATNSQSYKAFTGRYLQVCKYSSLVPKNVIIFNVFILILTLKYRALKLYCKSILNLTAFVAPIDLKRPV